MYPPKSTDDVMEGQRSRAGVPGLLEIGDFW